MKIKIFLFAFVIFAAGLKAQDTFSIVAVDTLTGEMGSAGASCIDNSAIAGGALIISDVLPGRGVIHTQSYWLAANQTNARNRMLAGDSPQQIIDWLVTNDVQNQPGRRQYGIVDLDPEGHPRSAAYTGATSADWKGHIIGRNYAIQGNILLNQGIVDSIESRFLRAEGNLSDKLMAALQGANVPGADSRCLNEGVSSLSAFLRVAKPQNRPDSLYLHLNVKQTPYGVEPIDSLQVLYDNWKMLVGIQNPAANDLDQWEIYPNPSEGILYVKIKNEVDKILNINVLDQNGKTILQMDAEAFKGKINIAGFKNGNYFVQIDLESGKQWVRKFVKI